MLAILIHAQVDTDLNKNVTLNKQQPLVTDIPRKAYEDADLNLKSRASRTLDAPVFFTNPDPPQWEPHEGEEEVSVSSVDVSSIVLIS